MKREIKSCPFCGGKAKAEAVRHGGKQNDFAYVECQNCNAKITYEIDVEYSAIDRAISEWNNRKDCTK